MYAQQLCKILALLITSSTVIANGGGLGTNIARVSITTASGEDWIVPKGMEGYPKHWVNIYEIAFNDNWRVPEGTTFGLQLPVGNTGVKTNIQCEVKGEYSKYVLGGSHAIESAPVLSFKITNGADYLQPCRQEGVWIECGKEGEVFNNPQPVCPQ